MDSYSYTALFWSLLSQYHIMRMRMHMSCCCDRFFFFSSHSPLFHIPPPDRWFRVRPVIYHVARPKSPNKPLCRAKPLFSAAAALHIYISLSLFSPFLYNPALYLRGCARKNMIDGWMRMDGLFGMQAPLARTCICIYLCTPWDAYVY